MKRKFKKAIGSLITIVILLVLPICIEKLIKDGIFGHPFPNSIFSGEQWFAFWGSYLGSIITIIVFFITMYYNRLETIRTIKNYELEKKYDRLLKNLEEIHNYINLYDVSGYSADRIDIVYAFRISEIRYYELINECEKFHKAVPKKYIELIKQMFLEYSVEIEKILENRNEKDFLELVEEYKETKGRLYSIKHKYVNEESVLFDAMVKNIEMSRINEKWDMLDIRGR